MDRLNEREGQVEDLRVVPTEATGDVIVTTGVLMIVMRDVVAITTATTVMNVLAMMIVMRQAVGATTTAGRIITMTHDVKKSTNNLKLSINADRFINPFFPCFVYVYQNMFFYYVNASFFVFVFLFFFKYGSSSTTVHWE